LKYWLWPAVVVEAAQTIHWVLVVVPVACYMAMSR
jgi:hypothetical protein